ncbi:MAG: hypothetical protein CMP39_04455 [Rickettsiales bacterium]|nr:hypothetical protein [Rickettsiales bacterium]|tara:strand:- start:163 stop:960 length:798 start_codon:yes stop_codon:yes gene_type:complete
MFLYYNEKRKDFKRCETLIFLSALQNASATLPNRGGWIEVKSSNMMQIFGLSASEFRNACNECEELQLVEKKKFGRFPFVRLLDTEIFSEFEPQNEVERTLDININNNINTKKKNIMSVEVQNEVENPKLILLPQQKVKAVDSEALPEFAEWWDRWKIAHNNLPTTNDCRKRSLGGLKNSSRAKAERAYLKLRESFDRDQIFLATRYYLVNKRESLQQTAHAERFLTVDLISQFLAQEQEEKEQTATTARKVCQSLDLSVGVYGT